MPIEVAIWEVEQNSLKKMEYTNLNYEDKLQNAVERDLSIISDELLTIGSQVHTAFGKKIDLLAMNPEGNLVIIELKRGKTPREVVAQTLDYASWVKDLSFDDIADTFRQYNNNKELEEAFQDKFGVQLPEELNNQHEMIVVCSSLDSESERIINYLSLYKVPINVVFFKYFKQNDKEFLTRSWLINPNELTEKGITTKDGSKKEPWNGKDFVCNIDEADGISSWEDCIKYGFISAGGKRWYIASLNQLFPGARVFAMIPGKGYLGVGIVKENVLPIKDFKVVCDKKETSILDVALKCEGLKKQSDDLEKCEHLVRVDWLATKKENDAFWVKGLRANQNSAFKLRSLFTLNKLVEHFGLEKQ
jgi:hypothetical protein